MGFLGTYEHQLDEKGRVSLPSAFRSGEEGERLVLIKNEQPCVSVFPMAIWVEVQARLLEFRKVDEEKWNAVRAILARAAEVAPDKQGRILVPSWLKDAAEIQGTVVLVGNIDRVEMWSPALYREHVQSASDEVFKRYGRQLF
jgi:MraZ protein